MTATPALYERFLASRGLCTDTRQLRPGELFLALRGPNFDANTLAGEALEAGAQAAIVDNPAVIPDGPEAARYIPVADGLAALQDLARHHRAQLTAPLLGLTGSNGKTTTKELLRRLLGTRWNVFATPGNRNNHIGLPLSLLQATAAHEVIVLEMGDNQPGDIAELCGIARPDMGLITNIGLDHLGGYDGMAANARGKFELFDDLAARGGQLYLNLDDPYQRAYRASLSAAVPVVTFAQDAAEADFRARLLESRLDGLRFELRGQRPDEAAGFTQAFTTRLPGEHNLQNGLAALCVAISQGLPPADLAAPLAEYVPADNRSQLLSRGGRHILLDAYNANPSSMEPALAHAFRAGTPPVGVVLADMLELGPQTEPEHRRVGEQLVRHRPAAAVLIGPAMHAAAEEMSRAGLGAHAHWFATREDAEAALPELLAGCRTILVKGSRKFALERLLPLMETAFPPLE